MSASPVRHPSPETLAAFAAGQMRAGFDFVTAVHVRGCATCAAELARLEAVGGALLDAPAAVDSDALEAVLARLDAREAAPAAVSLEDVMARARRRWVAPGVWTAKIDTPHAATDRVYLLSVDPGVAAALHTHQGAELTQVLSGALEDDGGVFAAGDFCERDPSVTHRPRVLGRTPCLCLFATEGRLLAKDWIGRIAFAIADV
ncbi:MAG: ChrR family anti-sigma-E factor [Hyphomonadaceae bacterium]